jgi:hypothetical protein
MNIELAKYLTCHDNYLRFRLGEHILVFKRSQGLHILLLSSTGYIMTLGYRLGI